MLAEETTTGGTESRIILLKINTIVGMMNIIFAGKSSIFHETQQNNQQC